MRRDDQDETPLRPAGIAAKGACTTPASLAAIRGEKPDQACTNILMFETTAR